MKTQRTPEPIRKYTTALIQNGAQLSLIIDHMTRASEEHPHPRAKPIPVVLSELIEGVLTERLGRFHPADVKTAARLLAAATEAIGEDLFFVDPSVIEEHGIPDLN